MGSTFVTTPVALALCFMDLGLHFESGVVHGVANTSDDWNLHEVEDESALRFWTTKVIFKKAFTSKPRIFVAFALLDLLNDSVDYRVATEPIEIANHSFKVKVSTWSDSKVWSVKVSWFAYPEVYEGEPHIGFRLLTTKILVSSCQDTKLSTKMMSTTP